MLLTKLLISIPPLFIAIILHEIAHGLSAYRLGDPTAKALGRITLNPLKHIDPMLSIVLPVSLILLGSPVVFGGAKPVPVNPQYFASPRRDMAIVAIAGPLTNFFLAIISVVLLKVVASFGVFPLAGIVHAWLLASIIINIALGLFNLIPIPPLDGGRIVVGLLPLQLARAYSKLEPYGFFILFAILYYGIPQDILGPAITMTIRAVEGFVYS